MSFTGSGGQTINQAASAQSGVEWLNLVDRLSVTGGLNTGRYNTTGLYNLWFGYEASSDPQAVSGSHNVGLGTYAGFKNQADYNVWVGSRAGFENLGGGENVGVGWNAGGLQTSAHGNTSLGFQAGYNALGDGNVSLGHGANSSGAAFDTLCNIAVGAAAHATGGDSTAIGPDSSVTGAGALAIGAGTTVSGEGTAVIGQYVTASGANSLILMPRPDGGTSTHDADEELNVYGVLTGRRDPSGAYSASLASDRVLLDNSVSRVALNGTGMELHSEKHITFLSQTNFAGPLTVSDTAVFTSQALLSDGMRVSMGTSVFDGPVVFNDSVSFASGGARYESLVAGDLVVRRSAAFSNQAAFSNGARFMGTTVVDAPLVLNDSLEALGGADIGGDLAVAGATVGTELDMDAGRIGTLRVTDLDVTGSIRLPDSFSLGSGGGSGAGASPGAAGDLQLANLAVGSNLLVRGTMSNSGTARFDDARADVLRVDKSLLVRGAASYEQDLHVAGALRSKDVHTGHVHAHKALACQVTATNGTFSNVDAVRFHCHEASIDELTVFKYTAALSNNAVVTSELVAGTAALQALTASNVAASSITASNLSAALGDVRSLSVSNATVSESLAAASASFSDIAVSGLSDLNAVRANSLASPDVYASNLSASNAAASNISVGGDVVWVNHRDTLSNHRWTAALDHSYAPNFQHADLVFTSTHGTVFKLTDDFEPGVLNFTGKHRCSWHSGDGAALPEPGLIVSAAGGFDNLDGGTAPTLDEALPVVRLSDTERDPAAFGVVAGAESPGQRVFRLANMVFSHSHAGDAKVILNSVGEGGMWVCDANGPVRNGDLLATSRVAGHAQRQGDDVVRSCTVAKVTGHPTAWEPYSDPVSGLACSRAFAGVSYKF